VSKQHSYSKDDLLSCAHGVLFGGKNARLPLPPMLMFDRISHIDNTGGKYNKGRVEAIFDIKEDLWFFGCHFETDPVMPGCLGLDAMWQLLGFFCGWTGAPGRGRALGVGEVKFTGEILPTAKTVRYELDIKKMINRKVVLGVADGRTLVDEKEIYIARDLRVGLFTGATS